MTPLLTGSLIAVWVVVLLNLLLTVRLLTWVGAQNAERRRLVEARPQLTVGAPAPDFRAMTLDGGPARLRDFAGRRVAFIFASPGCETCRNEMPMLARLAPAAKRNEGVELVLVSSGGQDETRAWLDAIREQDGLEVPLPVLVAPPSQSRLGDDYNPNGSTPFFCLVDERGRVEARSLFVESEWAHLRRRWEGVVRLAPWMDGQGERA
jgi:thiol-disulfide isomerase/thioredoxin